MGTGVIGPPDKLMYEKQYLASVDIVRVLLLVFLAVPLLIADKKGSYDI